MGSDWRKSLRLSAEVLARAADPDVLDIDAAALIEAVKLLVDGLRKRGEDEQKEKEKKEREKGEKGQ